MALGGELAGMGVLLLHVVKATRELFVTEDVTIGLQAPISHSTVTAQSRRVDQGATHRAEKFVRNS